MSRIDAVLFDLDDTLFDRSAAFQAVASLLFDSQPSIRSSHSKAEAVNHMIDCDRFDDRFDRILRIWPAIEMNAIQLRTWYYRSLADALRPDEMALSLLAELNRAGMPWGVVTNGDAFQHTKLRLLGIQELAPFVIVSGEFRHEKPDPEIFLEALSRLGAPPPQRTLFVGDNVHTDIKGAQGVSMLTAWIRLGRSFPAYMPLPDYQIDDVEELSPVLLGRQGTEVGQT